MTISYEIFVRNKETGRGGYLTNEFSSRKKAEAFKEDLERVQDECTVTIYKRTNGILKEL